jgi:glutathione synthase/RimK-type ligase-like ATP-grasp enzyme
MLLIITNKKDYTADFLILALKTYGVDFFRLNTEDFPEVVELVLYLNKSGFDGFFRLPHRTIHLAEIRSVWYRRPLASKVSSAVVDSAAREFCVTESRETLEGLWRAMPCLWVSHPDSIHAAEHKLFQLKVAVDVGFTIPETLVTNSPNEAQSYCHCDNLLVYKPLRRGRITRGEDVSYIYTNVVEQKHASRIENVRFAPSLFQLYIDKAVEIRATVVSEQVFAVELHSQEISEARHDWRRVEMERLPHEPHQLPHDVESKCIQLVRTLGLRFGAIDLILTPEGEYVFLEINPNGQWAWIQEICPDLHIREALIDLLISEDVCQ